MKKISKKRLLIGVIIVVIGGIIMFGLYNKAQLEKQAELERNREYEVSLVNTLKNTYAGIEEIKLVEPEYRTKPTSWVTKIEIRFQDGTEIKYRLSYELQTKIIRSNTIKKST